MCCFDIAVLKDSRRGAAAIDILPPTHRHFWGRSQGRRQNGRKLLVTHLNGVNPPVVHLRACQFQEDYWTMELHS